MRSSEVPLSEEEEVEGVALLGAAGAGGGPLWKESWKQGINTVTDEDSAREEVEKEGKRWFSAIGRVRGIILQYTNLLLQDDMDVKGVKSRKTKKRKP